MCMETFRGLSFLFFLLFFRRPTPAVSPSTFPFPCCATGIDGEEERQVGCGREGEIVVQAHFFFGRNCKTVVAHSMGLEILLDVDMKG